MQSKKLKIIIFFLTIVLCTIGILMVYSSSNIWAEYKYGDSYYYLRRQILFFSVGLILMFIGYKIPSYFLQKYCIYLVFISLILLILVIIPGIGIIRNGSRSWFGIGSFAFQPSELFKIVLITYLSSILSKEYDKTRKIKVFIPVFMFSIIGFILIMLQPDFGTAMIMILSIILLLFISRLSMKYFIIMGGLGISLVVLLIIIAPYRFERITAYIDPWKDPLGAGFQIIQSMYAIGPGGLLGSGLFNSYQKHFYLPEPQTDFIFAILVEELGLLGGLLVILLFALLFIFGFKLATLQQNKFNCFLITGLLGLLCIQVIINLGVVTAVFPITGITLPLISYGGTSLSISLFCIGLILGRKTNENYISC